MIPFDLKSYVNIVVHDIVEAPKYGAIFNIFIFQLAHNYVGYFCRIDH